jgi:subtilisin
MNIKKAIFYLAFSTFLVIIPQANAATDDNRYLVKSTSSFWEKSFQAHNIFNDGFTANLSDFQLKIAKVFGIEVQSVKKLNILATTTPTPTPKKIVKVANPKTPTDSIAWGVRLMYGDTLDKVPTGGEGVKIAILDTGVSKLHPDLKRRIVECVDFTTSNPTDGKCDDGNGHGTHVAGIIAADGGPEGKGIYGMAPGSDILAYKVCSDDGTCFSDDLAIALRAAVDNGANIIIISVGSDSTSKLIDNAISYATDKQVLVIAAAGNDGPYTGSIDYPASNVNVISVGAIDSLGTVPDWSARGLNNDSKAYLKENGDIEFSAPGVNIQSTWNNSDYSTLSGSSMSAAHIAGLAVLEWQIDDEKPADATREILHKFAQDILPTGDDAASGWGIPRL